MAPAIRLETFQDQLSAAVTSVVQARLEQRFADLFCDQQDVDKARDVRGQGAIRVNIRDIEESRVFQLVDGVRLANCINGCKQNTCTMGTAAAPIPVN